MELNENLSVLSVSSEGLPQESGAMDPRFLPLFANALLDDSLPKHDISIRTPRTERVMHELGRSGVLFALARYDSVRWHADDTEQDVSPTLQPWRRHWRDVYPRETVIETSQEASADQAINLEKSVVALLDPSYSRIQVPAIQNAVYPWLRRNLQGSSIEKRDIRRELTWVVGMIMSQLVDNIRESAHASKSAVILSAAGVNEDKTLQIVAIDNGDGIPGNLVQEHRIDDSTAFLERSLSGEGAGFMWGRGDGLAWISRLVKQYEGDVLVATGPTDEGGSVVLDRDHATDIASVYDSDAAIKGTVVVARLPLHSADPS